MATQVFRQRDEIPKWNFRGRLAGILGDFHVSYSPAPFVLHAISCNSGNAALRNTLLPLSGPWSAKEGSIWTTNIGNEPPEAGNEPEVQGDLKNQGCFHSCGEIVLKLANWFVTAKIGSNIPKSGMQVPLSKYQDLGYWSGTWQNCSVILSMHQLFWVLITGRLLQAHFNTPRRSQCPPQTLPLRFDL